MHNLISSKNFRTNFIIAGTLAVFLVVPVSVAHGQWSGLANSMNSGGMGTNRAGASASQEDAYQAAQDSFPSGSSGYGGGSSAVNNTGNYYSTVNGAVDSGVDVSGVNDFSGGNQNTTFGSACGSCTSTTYFYSNGNGTYNTVTTYSSGSITPTGNSGGNHGVGGSSCPAGYVLSGGTCVPSGSGTPPSGLTCPAGYFFYANGCYPPSCAITAYGVSCGTNAPPVAVSCPAGETLYSGSCYAASSCTTTSSGKGGSSTSCTGPATSSCPAGYILSGTTCYPSTPAPVKPTAAAPKVSIVAQPSLVRTGESTHLTWDGGSATECTISGTDGFLSHAVQDNTTINNVTERRVYTIMCDAGGPSASASTTVNILPVWREF